MLCVFKFREYFSFRAKVMCFGEFYCKRGRYNFIALPTFFSAFILIQKLYMLRAKLKQPPQHIYMLFSDFFLHFCTQKSSAIFKNLKNPIFTPNS
jgi:hypothetical protein